MRKDSAAYRVPVRFEFKCPEIQFPWCDMSPACASYESQTGPTGGCRTSAEPAGSMCKVREHVTSLIFCPEVPIGTVYELVRRDDDGSRRMLYSGILDSLAPSLNLAKIRYRGARLGANEVVLVLPHNGASV